MAFAYSEFAGLKHGGDQIPTDVMDVACAVPRATVPALSDLEAMTCFKEERKTTRCSSSCCSFSHLPRRQRIAFLVMVPSGLLTREQPQNSHDPCREQPGQICARWETDHWKPGSTYRTSHLYHRPTAFRATRTGRLCGKKALNKKPAAASLHADGLRKNLAIIIAGFSGLVKCPTSPFCAGCIPTFWVTLLRPLAGE